MIRPLNFNKAKLFDIPDLLVFIRPLGSKLHRVFKLPELPEDKTKELDEVLNTICTAKNGGTWFFDLRSKEDSDIITDTIALMDIFTILVDLDKSPKLSN